MATNKKSAKRGTSDTPIPPATTSQRRTRRRGESRSNDPAPPPVDMAGVTGTEPFDTASDRPSSRAVDLTYEEVAEAAYHRYLQRGGSDGRDFDDWIQAEEELRIKRGRST